MGSELFVGRGLAGRSERLLEALARGRTDHQFFSQTFLGRTLHDGQLEYVQHANATVNCLATANRYGKTTVLLNCHFHPCVYKIGAEPRYMRDDGSLDLDAFLKVKYHTVHTGGEWETAALVHEDALKVYGESEYLQAFVKAAPRSKPPHFELHNGAKWKFRTLGHDASGIDGNSFYVISIDEAGWVPDLEEKMRNVVRVRVADVRGVIHIVGTFKPGVSKDFYKFCVRASAYTGRAIGFDHRDDADDDGVASSNLDATIRKYLREFGIDLDEYRDALSG